MNRADYSRFANLLKAWAEIHGKPLSAGAIALWWQALERYDIDQVEHAFAQLVRDADRGQFMPKPADVIRILDGTSGDRAAVAWGKVLDAARRVGAYSDVVFDDAPIHAAVEDLGGWPAICRTDMEQLSYAQHRFAQAYRAYTGRPEGFEYPAVLTGDANASNRRNGQPLQPPALVGNPELARAVMERGGDARVTVTRGQLLPFGDVARGALARAAKAKGVV